MIQRRDLIAMLGGVTVAWPLRASSQTTSGLPLVAVLWPGKPEIEVDFDAALRQGLKDGGYVEGTNFAFAMRYANAESERFAPLAAELAALNPRVIIAAPEDGVLAMHNAAPTVPLVGTLPGDPIAAGLAASFARPGGMITGTTLSASGGDEALTGKRLSLLKELVPGISRVGLILVAGTPGFRAVQSGAEAASGRLGIRVLPLPVVTLNDVESAFSSGLRAGADAFLIDSQPLTFTNRIKVAEFSALAGKPTIATMPEQARAGLLTSYGNSPTDAWRTNGRYAAKILAGVKPGDLPIEQESKFLFVINLKTARELGVTVTPRLMTLADELVE
jgi:putative tryptophan/tyrosine transport system substrate-binding protein